MDEVPNELIKKGGKALVFLIYDLVHQIFRERRIPDNLNLVSIYPIYKKGNITEWKNWRPIALLNTIFRIMDKMIAKQLKKLI